MATHTATDDTVSTTNANWKAGVGAGLAGGLVFGALMSVMVPGVLRMAIPAMYGIEGPAGLIGWVLHMSHAAVIGLGFAALAEAKPDLVATTGKSVAVGAAYGLVVWVVLAVLVMPIWLDAVGFGGAPPLPNIGMESFVGHLVYGAVLGAVYPALAD